MSQPTTSLVLVYSLRGFNEFISRGKQEGIEYVILCDDPEVQRLAKSIYGLQTESVTQCKSFFSVADEVIKVIHGVNQWMKILAEKSNLDFYLFQWFQVPEGGLTTQRVQDALLLIASFRSHVIKFQPKTASVFIEKNSEWDSSVFQFTMESLKIPISQRSIVRFRFISKAKSKLLIYIREFYYLVNVLREGFFRFSKSGNPNFGIEDKILFQLTSSLDKHVDNISYLMEALEKTNQPTVALCWNSSERWAQNDSHKKLQKLGLQTENLEKSLQLKNVINSVYQPQVAWRNAQHLYDHFEGCLPEEYKKIQLAEILWPSIFFFIHAELPQRIRIDCALENRFRNGRIPKAVKVWGVNEFYEGAFLWRHIRKYGRPMKFSYWIGASFEQVYAKKDKELDLFLASDISQKKIAVAAYDLTNDSVKIVAQSRYQYIREFRAKYSQAESREELCIQKNKGMVIAYDPGAVILGYLTPTEQVQVTEVLLNLCQKFKNLTLMIKKHPNQGNAVFLDSQLKNCKLDNVIMIPKKERPSHFLNAADLLITKFSTLGLEAMYLNTPFLACLLDQEKKFQIFEEVPEYVFSIQSLTEKLTNFLNHESIFQLWADEQRIRREVFLKSDPQFTKEDQSRKAAAAIMTKLDSIKTEKINIH